MRVVILGSGQDGGVPQVGCSCRHCGMARSDPRHRRMPPSAAVVSAAGNAYILDPSPDLPDQLQLLARTAGGDPPDGTIMPKGICVTHCHWGHYVGLGWLGNESAGVRDMPVYCSASVAGFIRANRPWSDLVSGRHVDLRVFEDESVIELEPGLGIRPRWVPHRDDVTDTVAYEVMAASPQRTVLYMPDVDDLNDHIIGMIRASTTAIIDGTFFSAHELDPQGRSISDIPHPPMGDALALLEDVLPQTTVVFTHFNHTNPVVDPGSEEREIVLRAGFRLAHDGLVIE